MMKSSPLWSSLGIVAPLYARTNGMTAKPITGVSIDTRTLAPGDLFFAIKGDHSDGHDYVAAAFENGAAAAVVDEAHASALFQTGPLYIVHDTLAAIGEAGQTDGEPTKLVQACQPPAANICRLQYLRAL